MKFPRKLCHLMLCEGNSKLEETRSTMLHLLL